MTEGQHLDICISEYNKLKNTENTRAQLMADHDWTEDGAEAVLQLVNDYGSFMLRNALALAVVTEKEDGNLGF